MLKYCKKNWGREGREGGKGGGGCIAHTTCPVHYTCAENEHTDAVMEPLHHLVSWGGEAGVVYGVSRLHPDQVALVGLHETVQQLQHARVRLVPLIHHYAVHILWQTHRTMDLNLHDDNMHVLSDHMWALEKWPQDRFHCIVIPPAYIIIGHSLWSEIITLGWLLKWVLILVNLFSLNFLSAKINTKLQIDREK